MKNYSNIIQQNLNENTLVSNVNNAQDVFKVTLHLPKSIYQKSIKITDTSIEECVGRIDDIAHDFFEAVQMELSKAQKQIRESSMSEEEKIEAYHVANKEYSEATDIFESGYFTIQGDRRKFSTNITPFHYYFAKGRMSFDEMLEWAADIYTPTKKVA